MAERPMGSVRRWLNSNWLALVHQGVQAVEVVAAVSMAEMRVVRRTVRVSRRNSLRATVRLALHGKT